MQVETRFPSPLEEVLARVRESPEAEPSVLEKILEAILGLQTEIQELQAVSSPRTLETTPAVSIQSGNHLCQVLRYEPHRYDWTIKNRSSSNPVYWTTRRAKLDQLQTGIELLPGASFTERSCDTVWCMSPLGGTIDVIQTLYEYAQFESVLALATDAVNRFVPPDMELDASLVLAMFRDEQILHRLREIAGALQS